MKRGLCLVLVFLLCAGLMAVGAGAEDLRENPLVNVGGTPVTEGGYFKFNDAGVLVGNGSADDYVVHYDAGSGTLTLKNATIPACPDTNSGAITVKGIPSLTIVLEGENKVGSSDVINSGQSLASSGISVTGGDLTIKGGGSLEALGPGRPANGQFSLDSYGICVDGDLTIEGNAAVIARGGETESGISCGVYLYGTAARTFSVSGGNVTLTGGRSIRESCGVMSNYIDISGGTVRAEGSRAAGSRSSHSVGLYCNQVYHVVEGQEYETEDGRVRISGGEVTAVGGEAEGELSRSAGILVVSGEVGISGGASVETSGGPSEYVSFGISATNVGVSGSADVSAFSGVAGHTSAAVQATDLTVSGSCSLTCMSGRDSSGVLDGAEDTYSYGISVTSCTVSGGSVAAFGGRSNGFSSGISAHRLTISGGEVSATGGECVFDSSGVGLAANDETEIRLTGSGKLTAAGGACTNDKSSSLGISGYKCSLSVSDSAVVIASATDASYQSIGVHVHDLSISGDARVSAVSVPGAGGVEGSIGVVVDTAAISGGELEVRSGTALYESVGIITYEDGIEMTGGDLSVISGKAEDSSQSYLERGGTAIVLYNDSEFTVRSGSVLASGAERVLNKAPKFGGYDGSYRWRLSEDAAFTAGPVTADNWWLSSNYFELVPVEEPVVPDPEPLPTYPAISQPAPEAPAREPVISSDEHGSVSVSSKNPAAGEVVTVLPAPDSGYVVDRVVILDADGNELPLSRSFADGTWTYEQPAEGVEIVVTYKPGEHGYVDIERSSWYESAVDYTYKNGLMEGVSTSEFSPNASMTRGMVWAVLARMDCKFVSGSGWLEAAGSWAAQAGVSDGSSPDGVVTREQFAVMLWRYAGEPASSGRLEGYTDAAAVSGWASEAMAWAVENGIITGTDSASLSPQGSTTRAQCAAMLMRCIENVL